jgi:Ca2+-binding RTX toxin-like protein
VLDGGPANDALTGGGGADTFILRTGGGSDTIADFDATRDLFDVAGPLRNVRTFWRGAGVVLQLNDASLLLLQPSLTDLASIDLIQGKARPGRQSPIPQSGVGMPHAARPIRTPP